MLEPDWQSADGAIRLYRGDCLEVMPQLDPQSIDLIATSPPYNCRKDYGEVSDEIAWSDYYILIGDALRECYRLLVKGGTIGVNVPGVVRWQAVHNHAHTWTGFDPNYKTHRDGQKVIGKGRIEPVGFRIFAMMQEHDPHVREPIIWIKGGEGSAITTDYRMGCDSDPYMRPCHEFILLGSKGQWFHRGGTGRRGPDAVPALDYTKDVWFISPKSSRSHPAVFPEELPTRLIKLFTHAPDSVVLDPFLGSGTSAIACIHTGRRFIGIERDPRYFDIAVDRCNEALGTTGLFAPRHRKEL